MAVSLQQPLRVPPSVIRRGHLIALGSALIVAVVAILTRLAFAPLIPPLLNPDSEGYVQAGWDLFRGNGLDLGLRRTPGYGVFIAGVFALLGERLSSIATAQHVLGVMNAILAYVLGRMVVGPVGGLVVGLLSAISGPLLLYEHFIMTETLSTTALLGSAIAMLYALRKQTPGWALAAGFSTGVALLCRPALQIVMFVGVAGLVVLLGRSPKQLVTTAGAFILGTSLFMFPWMMKNAVLYDNFTLAGPGRHLLFRLIRSDDGFSFARPGASEIPEEEPLAGARRVLMDQSARNDGSSNYKRFREELGLSEAETNRLQTHLAVEAIRAQPVYFLQGTLDIFLHVFVGEPINLRREGSDLAEVDWERPIRHLINPPPPRGDRATAQQLLSLWDPARWGLAIPTLFVTGVLAAISVRRSSAIIVLAAVAVAPQLLGAAMAGFALRFRYPFDPLIVIVAWYGLSTIALVTFARARARFQR
ncbi:MAG: glycosyltransferase family 39 protein [Chloroflexota bacterium]